ncbi:MAG TPA: hypothetical protein VFE33_06490 [Thermoanaerobaculia bacterium]|nr:hypothetical protein [Thermoanaerobaculia bacterium]
MSEKAQAPLPQRQELMAQWQTAMEVYKHHFDLFLKAVALYFAIVGAVAGFMYRDSFPLSSQRALSVLIAFLSVVTMMGCWMSFRYVKRLRDLVSALASDLRLKDFPFTGALSVSGLFSWTAGAIAVLALLNAFYFIR